MTPMKKLIGTAAIAATALMMSAPVAAKTIRMNIGYSVAEGHPYGTFMNTFAERFQTLSGGTVKVKVHCCHKMGSEQEQFKKLQLGTLDGTMIAQNNAVRSTPRSTFSSFPT